GRSLVRAARRGRPRRQGALRGRDRPHLPRAGLPMTFAIVPDERAGWVVLLDGYPQSHVNVDDPLDLAFEYVALAAAAIDATFPAPDRVRITHVGGGGLTLPRWIEATRPGSPQIV